MIKRISLEQVMKHIMEEVIEKIDCIDNLTLVKNNLSLSMFIDRYRREKRKYVYYLLIGGTACFFFNGVYLFVAGASIVVNLINFASVALRNLICIMARDKITQELVETRNCSDDDIVSILNRISKEDFMRFLEETYM